jgi:archaellum component FlaG (FlaF/FlaG flagellin family)
MEKMLDTLSEAQMSRLLGNPDHAAEILMKTVTNPDAASDQRSAAIATLGLLAQAQPQAVTTDMLAKVITVITNPEVDPADPYDSSGLRSAAIATLGQLAQAQPQAVTKDMLQAFVKIITEQEPEANPFDVFGLDPTLFGMDSTFFDLRPVAIAALGELAQAQPQAVTSNMLQTFVKIITDPGTNSDQRAAATAALGELAQARPQAVTADMLQKFIAIITDPKAEPDQRFAATTALASFIEADSQVATSEMIQTFISFLQSDRDSPGRHAAARLLFVIAICEPKHESLIRTELDKLQASSQPHLRMIASQALEMMTIGSLVEEARSKPKQIERIKSKLNTLIELDSYSKEEHFQFAAKIALQEIRKIEAEKK